MTRDAAAAPSEPRTSWLKSVDEQTAPDLPRPPGGRRGSGKAVRPSFFNEFGPQARWTQAVSSRK